MQYKIFDAHLHTYGTFLAKNDDLISYLDRHNVEKAIITTVNRAASSKIFTKDDNRTGEEVSNENRVKEAFENFHVVHFAIKGCVSGSCQRSIAPVGREA